MMPTVVPNREYLYDVTGKVADVLTNHKAIIVFTHKNVNQRALLLYDKLKFNGLDLPVDSDIGDCLRRGSEVKFTCHSFDPSGPDRCNWFITVAWNRGDSSLPNSSALSHGCAPFGFDGKCNQVGVVSDVSKRQGILTFKNNYDETEKVLFLASKLFLYGNRAKDNLMNYPQLGEGSKLMFDAVPCNPEENSARCQWFATVVWCGPKKPFLEYDVVGSSLGTFKTNELLAQIKMVSLNPRSTFVRGFGQVLHILNSEYGLALGSIQPNRWNSVLFHRSMCFLFNMCLSGQDLTKIFKEGDKLHFIAVPAPKKFITQWIASNISVYKDPVMTDNLDALLSLL